jgi:hypothetical protein
MAMTGGPARPRAGERPEGGRGPGLGRGADAGAGAAGSGTGAAFGGVSAGASGSGGGAVMMIEPAGTWIRTFGQSGLSWGRRRRGRRPGGACSIPAVQVGASELVLSFTKSPASSQVILRWAELMSEGPGEGWRGGPTPR